MVAAVAPLERRPVASHPQRPAGHVELSEHGQRLPVDHLLPHVAGAGERRGLLDVGAEGAASERRAEVGGPVAAGGLSAEGGQLGAVAHGATVGAGTSRRPAGRRRQE